MKYYLYDTHYQNVVGLSNYSDKFHLDRWDTDFKDIDKLLSHLSNGKFPPYTYKVLLSLIEARYYRIQSKIYNIKCWAGINPHDIIILPYEQKTI